MSLLGASWGFPASQASRFRDALIAFAALSFLSEAFYVKLRIGRAFTDSSVAFIPFIASIHLFESGWAVVIAALVTGLAESLVRHKPPIRVAFNVSQQALSVWLAATVFKALGGVAAFATAGSYFSDAGGATFGLVPLASSVSIAAYFFLNITAVSVAVSLSEGLPLSQAWLRIGGASFVYDLVSSPLGILLAYLYSRFGMLGILALILPLYFVRHTYRVNMQLEDVNRELLELMVKAIEARDPYTSGHSLRVSQMAEILAKDLGLGHKFVEQIRTAALLHDVGKIHEEYAPLLRKEGKLDATEKALMQTHSARSAELVSTISAFKGPITEAVRHHHENFDGTGYPDGVAGRAIPIGSRIIMIADTVDAMTTDRPYRKALSFDRVTQEMTRFSGKQFDPELVDVCLRSVAIKRLVESRVVSQSSLPSLSGLDGVAPPTPAPRIEPRVAARRQKASTA